MTRTFLADIRPVDKPVASLPKNETNFYFVDSRLAYKPPELVKIKDRILPLSTVPILLAKLSHH